MDGEIQGAINYDQAREKERNERIRQSNRKYAMKRWVCETCETNTGISHRSRHLKSMKHIKNNNEKICRVK
jgi:hypothetical protein